MTNNPSLWSSGPLETLSEYEGSTVYPEHLQVSSPTSSLNLLIVKLFLLG